jgi:hypothetical protein
MPTDNAAERMTVARQAQRDQYLPIARAHFVRLGIPFTEYDLQRAADNLLKEAQRERMAAARATRWQGHLEAKKADDLSWAARLAFDTAYQLHTFAPTVPQRDQTRICLLALQDEESAPDGFNRARFVRRMEAIVESVKAQTAEELK